MVILGGFLFGCDLGFFEVNFMQNRTTIAAIATPPGRGGVGVIRLSGPKSYAIAEALTQKDLAKARMENSPALAAIAPSSSKRPSKAF